MAEDKSTSQEKTESRELTVNDASFEMETPHHAPFIRSKKWKNYLFEFFMVFFAVTAGFFVENKREDYIEHKTAAQFSKQLLAELRLDSVLFVNRARDIEAMQKCHDDLLYLLTKRRDATDREVLETMLPLAFAFDVPATTTTYAQMKASGSLRYIENMDLTAVSSAIL